MTNNDVNERAVIGDNNPPEPKTPFDKIMIRHDDLMGEARIWLDGTIVKTEAEASKVGLLMASIRDLVKEAEAQRVKENKPFDDGKKAVQERYGALIAKTKTKTGSLVLALNKCQEALAPWALEQERIAREEQQRKEEEARKAEEAALEAMQSRSGDLEDEVKAEELASAAEQAKKEAKKAAKVRGGVKVDGFKAVTTRKRYIAKVVDLRECARYFWEKDPDAMADIFNTLAQKAVNSGAREIPGVKVIEDGKIQ